MTFIFASHQSTLHARRWTENPLTLSPLATTPRHLTLDQLKHLELQHRMIDSQHPFEDLLPVSTRLQYRQQRTHRRLVLIQHTSPMRSMFGHFLKDLDEVDTGEEVSPRINRNDLCFFTVDGD